MTGDTTAVASAQLDDASTPEELLERYRRGVRDLRHATRGMSHEQLLARPVPGKMSTLEVVAHIADADQYLADRIKRTLATQNPLLVGVESASYPGPLHYDERDIELDLSLLEATRSQMAADLDRIDADAWQRTAIHTETGVVTVRQLVLHAIRHLEGHAETIAEKRRVLGI